MKPNFTEIYSDEDANELQDVYDTIHRLGLWDWFGEFNPHPNDGFMFTSDINVAMIAKELKNQGHSGASFGIVMRLVHHIAQNGWENHKNEAIKRHGGACPCRRAQGKVIRWCGKGDDGLPACAH